MSRPSNLTDGIIKKEKKKRVTIRQREILGENSRNMSAVRPLILPDS
jgi:hypothetical protein